ncbi:MAG: thiamine pyrophosphate-binding protein [Owenweeksia sp.]|nr:thiamine pyrophosphate-binding protein [Owenweeksia sp.]
MLLGPDERAAGFTALGMTLETGEPVALACTSGSAAANYYPAVVEAFYQHRPLVVLTADRPQEIIDQGWGKPSASKGFSIHILKWRLTSCESPLMKMARQYNQRLINEALHAARMGPVHINIPFDEPLYGRIKAPGSQARFIRP